MGVDTHNETCNRDAIIPPMRCFSVRACGRAGEEARERELIKFIGSSGIYELLVLRVLTECALGKRVACNSGIWAKRRKMLHPELHVRMSRSLAHGETSLPAALLNMSVYVSASVKIEEIINTPELLEKT